MRIHIAGRNLEDILPAVERQNVEIVESSPDLVITHGGDGALLGAEREFPGVPKLPVRDFRTAPRCEEHSSFEKTFDQYLNGGLEKTELIKIVGIANGKQICGINDIFIHNVDRGGALRYRVMIDGRPYRHEIIGDGLGLATIHGSTAYYRSITHSIFKIGIGLAFNNSTAVTNHQVLPEETIITVRMIRGPAILVADNSPERIKLETGDEITMKKIEEKAVVYGLELFMCSKCRKLRHSQSNE
jgi:NAD kinase